ncbi:DUF3558 family protein [Nocardioides nematodiphilus]|uniref:DUF3558 family protein n=1 Tax=Nocardioides nematodiphilus TaxID=2849669 RepID=UPI001CDA092B|nr:DUF3558 family protein [Nocardioides nematodiphilus]MCA1981790.1 DUF3558 family protein [Nocardioides nematodiphilus]
MNLTRAALLLLAPLALAGCGGAADNGATSDPTPAPASASTPATSSASSSASPTGKPFNPCDGLDVAAISQALGSPLKLATGTAAEPRCALLPKKHGDPTFELSYLWFDGGLDAAWQAITDKPAGAVTEPQIKGADATKLIVQRKKSGYLVSAFMQNGDLIQSLNGAALPPYDASAMQRATTAILTQLSAAAPAG